MRVVREDLVGDRVDILAVVILREVQLDQVAGLERGPVDGVGAVFLEPGQDVG